MFVPGAPHRGSPWHRAHQERSPGCRDRHRVRKVSPLVPARCSLARILLSRRLGDDSALPRLIRWHEEPYRGDGGYLIFHGVSPLVDGRADPFTRFFDPSVTVSRDYLDSYLLRADIRPFLDRYGVTHLLVPRELRVYGVLSRSADFETVYRDDTDAILVYRRASNNASDTVGSH